jgi:hypothetical protein
MMTGLERLHDNRRRTDKKATNRTWNGGRRKNPKRKGDGKPEQSRKDAEATNEVKG